MNVQNIDIKEIQNNLLEILLYFETFCKENDLKFLLAGGTCLGAIRHQGFIPWDDDIDVFMLRDDYEKLEELWNKNADTSRYSCVRSNEFVNIHHSATEIKDNKTTFITKHSKDFDLHQGLMIDVIPIDGVANGFFSRMYQYAHAMLYACFNFQRLPEHKSKFTYYLTKIALTLIKSPKLRYKIWKSSEKKHSKYSISTHDTVASFGEGLTIMRQHFPKEWFLHPSYATFEGHQMPVPSDVNKYLEISYGNYMELPPEEERVFRHNIEFIDLKNSYTKYRGIKYFTKENVDGENNEYN